MITLQLVDAQRIITGVIVDSLGQPIINATVSLHQKKDGLVLDYTSSNSAGAFQLEVADSTLYQDTYLTIFSPGYISREIGLVGNQPFYKILLLQQLMSLPPVLVRARKNYARISHDTVRYQVADFLEKTDRVIGDVIRKLPGIEIDNNGKISYQGKPISHFYIDGDDLLEGRYNIASRGIPAQIVNQVQIFENHQDIKVLENIIAGSQPALNIELKPGARSQIFNRIETAVGTVGSIDVGLNEMLFKKNVKFIDYYKYNNIGKDATEEINSLTSPSDALNISGDKKSDKNLLSLGTTGNPNLLKKRYLLNHAHLFTLNNLVNLKNGISLKTNIYFINDRINKSYLRITDIFSYLDTIHYKEKETVDRYFNQGFAQVSMESNKKDFYFKNTTGFMLTDQNEDGNVNTATISNLKQTFRIHAASFSNQLNLIKDFRNIGIFSFSSTLETRSNPQSLEINNGLYPDLLNSGIVYDGLVQKASQPLFFMNNIAAIRLSLGQISMGVKIGHTLQTVRYQTGLFRIQLDSSTREPTDSFRNNFIWNLNKVIAELTAEWNFYRGNLKLAIPTEFQYSVINDLLTILPNRLPIFIKFDPILRLNYRLSSSNQFSVSLSRLSNTNGPGESYQGYVLENYRNLVKNNNLQSRQFSYSASFNYSFKQPAKLWFVNTGIGISQTHGNSSPTSLISEQIDIVQRIFTDYKSNRLTFYSGISKYFFKLKTTGSVKANWLHSSDWQIQNSTIGYYFNNSWSFSLSTNTKIMHFGSVDYIGTFLKSQSAQETTPLNPPFTSTQIRHQFNLNVSLLSNLTSVVSVENYQNTSKGTTQFEATFLDLTIVLKSKKLPFSTELSFSNIANVNQFVTIDIQNNFRRVATYEIRPRLLMFKIALQF